ncbi:iron complex outermembrane receptor protein [Flavobacterium araucananum]|uniref:TonB-dependent siderophore receptor n=1 Tax=Flavobacterium araucananum TaxID=946678 RepID=A0A227PJW5_9FLAO|nr:TonB-dependent receptor [Flavobacterium araucananum]OXG09335.1 TonB-dependent siderophore receptor [Flavobacterium araucananum]PWK02708.1 iron complex outermembrane receptor protein [Flavobacterium araucananum]
MKYKFTISFLSFCFFLLAATSISAQEKASIKGQISLANSQAADNVSIVLKGTKIGTNTDSNGFYEIKNLKPGNYVIKVSSVGHSSKEKSVSLNAGDEIVEDFTITANSEQLDEIVINGNGKKNSLARKETQQVSRLPLKNLENPQVYTTITSELLKEQVVTNIDDALKNAPGLSPLWASTGRGGDGAAYFSLRGFAVQPSMINGLPALSNGSLDPANIEKIEVIKGPSGTLFGSSLISYGGLINLTTKKPYDHFGGEINYTAGSYGLNRVTADVNTPLDDEHKVNLRINTAYHNENSFQDAGFKKSFFFAPSLSYQVSDRLSFFINTEFMNNKSTNPTMLFLDRGAPLRVHNMNELGYDNKRSYTSNELAVETPSYSLQGQMNYKISDQWTSQTVVSRNSAKTEGYYSYLYEGTQYTTGIPQGIVLGRQMNYQNATTLITDIQQNFIGDFKIGKLRNRIVAGLDYFNRGSIDNGSGYVANGNIYIGNLDVKTVNENLYKITDPTKYITNGDSGKLTKAGAESLLASAPMNNNKTKQEVISAYVSDVINFTPALSAMASLRADRFMTQGDVTTKTDDYNQTAFSPKFGLVYQPIIDKVSVFANYMDGFANSAPTSDILADGTSRPRTFSPEHANQFEVGTKLNIFKDRLYATFSYYNTEVKYQVYTVYTATTQTSYQDGAQRNKGFEAEIVANPIDGLNIVFGYSYNDALLTAGDPDFVGHRPESAGPQNLANLWASYRFIEGDLKGFGLGFGGNYASDNKIMNRTLTGQFTIPEYTVLNSSVFYGTEKFTLTLKLDNIANVDTYDGWSTIHPKNMRSLAANFSYRF